MNALKMQYISGNVSYCIFSHSRRSRIVPWSPQTHVRWPAWNRSWSAGIPAGRSSCRLWPSGRLSSTTVRGNQRLRRPSRDPPASLSEHLLLLPSPLQIQAGTGLDMGCVSQKHFNLKLILEPIELRSTSAYDAFGKALWVKSMFLYKLIGFLFWVVLFLLRTTTVFIESQCLLQIRLNPIEFKRCRFYCRLMAQYIHLSFLVWRQECD